MSGIVPLVHLLISLAVSSVTCAKLQRELQQDKWSKKVTLLNYTFFVEVQPLYIPYYRSSVSALEMQYATETAIKAHNSRLKAAAAAANQLLITSVSTTITTVALSSSLTTASTSSCTTASSSVDTSSNHSNGNSGLVSQKRRQRSRNQNIYSSTTSPVQSSSKTMPKM